MVNTLVVVAEEKVDEAGNTGVDKDAGNVVDVGENASLADCSEPGRVVGFAAMVCV